MISTAPPGRSKRRPSNSAPLRKTATHSPISLFKQQGHILGYGIADLVRVFDPGLIVLGGGLAEAKFRDQFLDWVKEGFNDRAWSVYRHSPIEPEKSTTELRVGRGW